MAPEHPRVILSDAQFQKDLEGAEELISILVGDVVSKMKQVLAHLKLEVGAIGLQEYMDAISQRVQEGVDRRSKRNIRKALEKHSIPPFDWASPLVAEMRAEERGGKIQN